MRSETVKTVCNLCGRTGCGMEVVVENGVVVDVRGDKDHPESKGALCPKGNAIKDILYSPERLKYPVKRVGERGDGEWKRIAWDEALTIIVDKLQRIKAESGAESVWFHKGSGHDVCSGDLRGYLHRLANVYGSPNVSCPFYVCYGPRTLNLYFMTGGIPAPDADNAECIVLWGINVTETAPTRHVKVQHALKRGVKLIVVDPRKTFFAEKADVHLQPRPGSDGALALGMLNVIVEEGLYDVGFTDSYTVGFEELREMLVEYTPERVEELTWIPAEEIRRASQLYARAPSACIFLGNALDQQTGSSQAIRAITALMAVTGNLDVQGGNVVISPIQLAKNPVELHSVLSEEQAAKQLGKRFLLSRFEYTRLCHPPSVYRAILEGDPYPVKAAFIMAGNPMLTSPNTSVVKAAFEKLDFLVVADMFMTDTAEMADIVLPACTFLEQTYYSTYQPGADLLPEQSGLLILRPEVVPPIEESWPDWKIIFELARRMGYGEYFPWSGIEEAIDHELAFTGINVSQLRQHPEGVPIRGPSFMYPKFGSKGLFGQMLIGLMNRFKFKEYPHVYKKYENLGFQTPSGKVEIYSERFKEMGLDPLPSYREPEESPLNEGVAGEYPLVLTTGAKMRWFVHSQMRNIPSLGKHRPDNIAELNPETASTYGLVDGESVRIKSPRGVVECELKVTEKIMPRVVQLYHGYSKANANILTDNSVFDPVTGSASMRSGLCEIEKRKTV